MSDNEEYEDENLDLEEIIEGDEETHEQNNENIDSEAPQEAVADPENDDDGNQPSKPKRVIRNPQPKLNSERLKGPRGIHKLESVFEKVKFKGRGHEEEDLNTLMKNYEYWCHRLFPKLPFDNCLLRIEQLGLKKDVQTHIKKIRMNMLIDESETNGPLMSDEEDNFDAGTNIQNLNTKNVATQNHNDIIDEFDDLIANVQPVTHVQKGPEELSEEQMNQIRLNKEKAMKLRAERLKRTEQKLCDSLCDQKKEENENSTVPSSVAENTEILNYVNTASDLNEIGMQCNDFE